MRLSKSRYTRGVQCPKMLWMHENMPSEFDDSVYNSDIMEIGDQVGDLAMGYFGEYVEVPFEEHGFEDMIARTRELMDDGVPVICEATFAKDDNFCQADILRKVEGGYDLIEVKSATRRKDVNMHDIAYQTWLLREHGLDIRRSHLMHLNPEYIRGEELDLQELFVLEDVTDEVEELVAGIPGRIEAMRPVVDGDEEPDVAIGPQCFSPFECGFRKWCFRSLPSPSVFDLNRIRKDKAQSYMLGGIYSFQDLLESGEFESLTHMRQLQVIAETEDRQFIDEEAIEGFLDELWFPLYFLDFETFVTAIPEYPGTWPWRQIPSQYSIHIARSDDSKVEHLEFLAQEGADPRRSLAERLVKDIPENACVLAWNKGFEMGRIEELANDFPDLAPSLMAIRGNIRDLADPFRRGEYYTREMEGSYSIKKVLPALFPDDPELDYGSLEGVHNGGEAASAFRELSKRSPEEAAETREQLLRYCELDTLAMVKIWQKLKEAVGRA